MNARFSATYPALGFLNHKLQSGILLGIVGTSSVAGVAASAINSGEISQKLSITVNPVIEFAKSNVNPHLSLVKTGVSKISKTFYDWGKDVFSKNKDIFNWIKKQNIDNVAKGFVFLVKTFGDWSSSLRKGIENILDQKDSILKILSYEFISKILFNMSEFSLAIKETLSTLFNLASVAVQDFLSSASDKGKKSEESPNSLKKILMSGQLKEFFTASWQVVSENPQAIKNISGSQVKQLLNYAASNMKSFAARVDSLRKSSTEGNTGTGWSHYKNPSELINAIMNNSWGNLTVGVLNLFSGLVTKCTDKSKCNEEDVFLDTVKSFVSLFSKGSRES